LTAGKARAAAPPAPPADEEDPMATTVPLADLPVIAPAKPAPERGTPTVTVLPVAAPPVPRLLAAGAGATVAPSEDPTACLNRNNAAPARPPAPVAAPPSQTL